MRFHICVAISLAFISVSCSTHFVDGGKIIFDHQASIVEIRSKSGWVSRSALRPAEMNGEGNGVFFTGSDLIGVSIVCDDQGRMDRVVIEKFDPSYSEPRPKRFVVKSKDDTMTGNVFEIRRNK